MSALFYNEDRRISSGPKTPPLYNPDQNLGQLILAVLQQTPEAITQISADTGVLVTCGEMRDRVLRTAVYLSSLGLQRGDVVGIVSGNSENLAPAVFACFLLGLPVNPLTPIMAESEIVRAFTITRPKLILCEGGSVTSVQSAVNSMKVGMKVCTIMERVDGYECLTQVLRAIDNDCIERFTPPKVDPDAVLIILCSSGSTGDSKGICKSHRESIATFFDIYKGDSQRTPILFQFPALFWYTGFFFLAVSTLFKYVRVCTAQPYEPKTFVETMRRYKVNLVLTPPFTITDLLQSGALQPMEDMHLWLIGGARVSARVLSKFREFVPSAMLANIYGTTEGNIFAINYEQRKLESCGFPMPNLDIMIADENGEAAPKNVCGEIYTRSPYHLFSYFNNPQKTRESFHGEWLKTSDVGYFDDEGFLFILDRKSDILRTLDFSVTPSELESIINEIDGVASSCVVGVMDEPTGVDVIHAFVIAEDSNELTEKFIASYINERVSEQKRIYSDAVHFLKSFPLGLTGKVSRLRVRELARNVGA